MGKLRTASLTRKKYSNFNWSMQAFQITERKLWKKKKVILQYFKIWLLDDLCPAVQSIVELTATGRGHPPSLFSQMSYLLEANTQYALKGKKSFKHCHCFLKNLSKHRTPEFNSLMPEKVINTYILVIYSYITRENILIKLDGTHIKGEINYEVFLEIVLYKHLI